ncbi:sensor histidine kinase [Micromonospora maris]|uniref:sensor histidine kinase n=1 Tax=Micromonospora maris TaxID=1003110 RepID=UPI001E51784A|nr:sensor histidine kinase [Micromonospora maris]
MTGSPGPVARWSRTARHGLAGEIGPALVVLAVSLSATAIIGWQDGSPHPPLPFGYLLLTIDAALIALHRRWPLVMLAGTLALSLTYHGLNFPGGAFTIPPAVAIYFAVVSRHRLAAGLTALAFLAGVFLLGPLHDREPNTQGAVWLVAWLSLIMAVGEAARSHQERLRQVQERAALAEATREEEARRRAVEERMRIARELHDVLAHRISTVTIQAGVAAHLIDRDVDQAREALLAIRETSRGVLVEMRSTLGMLRRVDEDELPTDPVPGMADLDSLVRDAEANGVDVALDVVDVPAVLPASLDLALYRIVQESLTNVIRHSGAVRARVRIVHERGEVEVEVRDDGRGAPPEPFSQGNGLLGMRERVAAVNGTFEARGADDGGFVVSARMPLRSDAR